ncbi:MAG TPA: hypothetical protein VN765_01175 [Candidatus Acidoferrum sp.]|nr:hypothetical protein [Candidatus Acidoferrum sp.]
MSTSPLLLLTPERAGKREGESALARGVTEPPGNQETMSSPKETTMPKAHPALTVALGALPRNPLSAEQLFRNAIHSQSESPLND